MKQPKNAEKTALRESRELTRLEALRSKKRYAGYFAVLLIIIVFVVVLILLRLAGTGLSKLFEKIPVVGTLDKVLGVAVNFLVFAAVILVALYAWQHLWPDSFANFAKGAPVAGFIAQNNPLIGFFGE